MISGVEGGKGEYNERTVGVGCGYFCIRDRDRDGLKNPGKTVLNLKVDRAKREPASDCMAIFLL